MKSLHFFPLGHKWQENLPSFQRSFKSLFMESAFPFKYFLPFAGFWGNGLTVCVRGHWCVSACHYLQREGLAFSREVAADKKTLWYLNRVTDMRCSGRAAATPVPGPVLLLLDRLLLLHRLNLLSWPHFILGHLPSSAPYPYTHGLFYEECW